MTLVIENFNVLFALEHGYDRRCSIAVNGVRVMYTQKAFNLIKIFGTIQRQRKLWRGNTAIGFKLVVAAGNPR